MRVRARGGTESGEKDRHFIYLYLDICDALDLKYTRNDVKIRFFPERSDKKRAEEIMHEYKSYKCITFQVGSKSWKKSWPEERWIELGKKILRNDKNARIILVGSKNEFGMNEQVKNGIGSDRVKNVCGESLSTIGAILKRCDLMIGNTSGLLHLASAVGTKTIGLFWVAVPSQSKPIGIGMNVSVSGNTMCDSCKDNHVYDNEVFNYACRHSISVNSVFNVVKKGMHAKVL